MWITWIIKLLINFDGTCSFYMPFNRKCTVIFASTSVLFSLFSIIIGKVEKHFSLFSIIRSLNPSISLSLNILNSKKKNQDIHKLFLFVSFYSSLSSFTNLIWQNGFVCHRTETISCVCVCSIKAFNVSPFFLLTLSAQNIFVTNWFWKRYTVKIEIDWGIEMISQRYLLFDTISLIISQESSTIHSESLIFSAEILVFFQRNSHKQPLNIAIFREWVPLSEHRNFLNNFEKKTLNIHKNHLNCHFRSHARQTLRPAHPLYF